MEKAQEIFEAALRAEDDGDFDKALQLYEEAARMAPTRPHPRVRMTFLLYKQGKWKHAITVARPITKRWPRVSETYWVIARSYAQLGHWRMAERFYRRALAIKQDAGTWLLLGWVLDRLRRHNEAEECVHEALRVDPDYDEAHYNLGHIYKENSEFALAEKHLKRAIEIDPKYAVAYAKLGELLSRDSNRAKEAASVLKKAVEYNLNDGWSRAYLANALWTLRKLKAAHEQYRALLELWPNNSLPYWLYGDFLACESRDISPGEPYLRKAVEIDPKGAEANYYLGKHLYYSIREGEAKRFLKKAARLGHSRARKLLSDIERSEV